MIDETTANIIEQLTLYKLDFSRDLLKEANLPYTGNRSTIRERMMRAVEDERFSASILKELLNELDLWGQQRTQWIVFPQRELQLLQTPEAIALRARQADMEALLEGEVVLVPSSQFAPMVIAYEERNANRFLKLIGAKAQIVREEQKQLEPIRYPEHPHVVYYPFMERPQKVITFAEINMETGITLLSATLIRQGIQFVADFTGLMESFQPFISFANTELIDLYQANHLLHSLPTGEVQLAEGRRSTSSGGTVSCKAHNPRADIRADNELSRTHQVLPDAPGVFCNCFWEPDATLKERVHTHIYGPNGEISILGKVKEESARHVLRRIYELNHA